MWCRGVQLLLLIPVLPKGCFHRSPDQQGCEERTRGTSTRKQSSWAWRGTSSVGVAGPGPSTQAHCQHLSGRQGTHSGWWWSVTVWGKTLSWRCMAQSLQDCWCLARNISFNVPMDDGSSCSPGNIYALFVLKMDWRMAEWVVKDNICHNSFDHFLQIPGVSCLSLYFQLFSHIQRSSKNYEFFTSVLTWFIRSLYLNDLQRIFLYAWLGSDRLSSYLP